MMLGGGERLNTPEGFEGIVVGLALKKKKWEVDESNSN